MEGRGAGGGTWTVINIGNQHFYYSLAYKLSFIFFSVSKINAYFELMHLLFLPSSQNHIHRTHLNKISYHAHKKSSNKSCNYQIYYIVILFDVIFDNLKTAETLIRGKASESTPMVK